MMLGTASMALWVGVVSLHVRARKVTVANLCGAPVWAAYNGLYSEAITVNGKSGVGMWQQASGQEDVLDVPENWTTGRIWPATGCDDSGNDCVVGGCLGGKCDGKAAGQSGATLAEFTIHPTYETFDISIVDGYNVPIAIIPTGGSSDTCKKVTCGVQTDLLTVCDPSLAYPQGSDTVWSCLSPCTAQVQFAGAAIMPFDQTTARTCCPENTPEACPSDTIPFYDVYKPLCNDAFLYAPDMNGNVVCVGPEYRIEFCPGGKGLGANPSGNPPVAQCAGGEIVGGGGSGTNDDGGGTSGMPAGAGQACDAGASGLNGESSGSSGSSGGGTGNGDTGSSSAGGGGTEAATTAGSGNGGTGAGTAGAGAGAGSDGARTTGAGTAAAQPSGNAAGAATGDGASGAVAASNAGYWGTVASTAAAGETGTAAAGGNTTAAATTRRPTGQAAVPASSAPAANTSACRGRGCRGGGRGGRPGRKREQGGWGWVW